MSLTLKRYKLYYQKKIDYIIDFVGRPESDPQELIRVNKLPAEVMLQIAEKYDVNNLGFIGGISGPKSFVNIKAQIIKMLESRKKSFLCSTNCRLWKRQKGFND